MRDIAAQASGSNLDGAVSTQFGAQGLGTATDPVLCGRVVALLGLSTEGLVLKVKGHDDIAPGFPDLAAALSLVVENVAKTVVVSIKGILVLVKVTSTKSVAVGIGSATALVY